MAIEIVDSPIVIFHSYVSDYQRGSYVSEYCESCVDATDKRPVLLVYFHVRMQFPYSVTYPPVSSNVAIVYPLEIGISIAKSFIHRQCMFNCHVWLPEGTVHDRNRSLWKSFHAQSMGTVGLLWLKSLRNKTKETWVIAIHRGCNIMAPTNFIFDHSQAT